MNIDDNFAFDFREEAEAPQEEAVVNNSLESEVPQEEGQEQVSQPSVEELMAKIQELESAQSQARVVERMPDQAAAILQDKNAIMELGKDYEEMPLIDLLRMDFEEKNKNVLEANPGIDRDNAFRKYLQRNYNPDIEPLIEENLGLDEYEFALLQAKAEELRNARIEKQASIKAALSGNFQQEVDSTDSASTEDLAVDAPADMQEAMKQYEQSLLNHIEASLKNIQPSAPDSVPQGINIPAVGEDALREMINTLAVDQLPLLVAEDNNVYPNVSLLKELAEYRQLRKDLPNILNSYKEKIVAEAFENFKNGLTNKADLQQSPANPYSQQIISPLNIGESAITGLKI
jgi:hypothetical protein